MSELPPASDSAASVEQSSEQMERLWSVNARLREVVAGKDERLAVQAALIAAQGEQLAAQRELIETQGRQIEAQGKLIEMSIQGSRPGGSRRGYRG